MAEKKITISLEQLHDIVSDAVASALKKIENIEVVEHQPSGEETSDVKAGEFSKEQLDEAMDVMARNRGAGDEPKVGIFWLD